MPASADDLKIALIYGKTGPLEAYAKQTENGLRMGLEYATKNTMTVDGRKIVLITKDDQGKPDLAKAALAEAYQDDKVDLAIGTTASGAALAMLPIAEENKKVLIVEPAVADAITGEKWNRYIFRTGRNSSQDAISNAVAIGKQGVTIATLGRTTHLVRTASLLSRKRSARPARHSPRKNMSRRRPPTSPQRRSACSMR
jgi:branched-chain amino acid transport system substrate-binding protein